MAKKWPPPKKFSGPVLYYVAKFAQGAKFPFLNWEPLCFSYSVQDLLAHTPDEIADLCVSRCAILSRSEGSKPHEFRIEYEFHLATGWKPPTLLT